MAQLHLTGDLGAYLLQCSAFDLSPRSREVLLDQRVVGDVALLDAPVQQRSVEGQHVALGAVADRTGEMRLNGTARASLVVDERRLHQHNRRARDRIDHQLARAITSSVFSRPFGASSRWLRISEAVSPSESPRMRPPLR